MKTRHIVVDVACNHPENGQFSGAAYAFDFGSRFGNIEIRPRFIDADGEKFAVDETRLKFTIGRVTYPFAARGNWAGNWCVDAFRMKRPQAVRLLVDLVSKGDWTCECAPSRIFEWLKRKEPA